MFMIATKYLDELMSLRDNFSVKIITGFRGTGKSFLLKSFAEQLKAEGVAEEAVVFIDCEREDKYTDFRQLYESINEQIADLDYAYLLFDEIQNVDGWEKAVNAFFLGAAVEIYITGANEKLLVEKLQALLPENYDVLKMYPLSFAEYVERKSADNARSLKHCFIDYLQFGGLPLIAETLKNVRIYQQILRGCLYETICKDAAIAYSMRKVETFFCTLNFFAKNIGKPIKLKDLQEFIASRNAQTSVAVLENYLKAVDDLEIFIKVPRYDLAKDTVLRNAEQFFCVDNGICGALLNFAIEDENALVKNAVCLELIRRGYEIYCPKFGNVSADFFAVSENQNIFVQILPVGEERSANKVLEDLSKLPTNVEKILLSAKPVRINEDVRNMSFTQFLLGDV